MEWQDHQDRSGLVFEHPVGWIVQELPGPAIVVRGPDQRAMVLIQPLRSVARRAEVTSFRRGFSQLRVCFRMPSQVRFRQAQAVLPRGY